MSMTPTRPLPRILFIVLIVAMASPLFAEGRQLTANVVTLDHVIMLNRLGASLPEGEIFALLSDVVPSNCYAGGGDCTAKAHSAFVLQPGQVILRKEKRARPIVLRMNVGDTLTINFWNLLAPSSTTPPPPNLMQPATRATSLHAMGLSWNSSSSDDGSAVGANKSSLATPPAATSNPPTVYQLTATAPGSFLLYSTGANVAGFGGTADAAQLEAGLFGALNVEPAGATYYRSQVTASDLSMATTGKAPDGHPLIKYDAKYPASAGDRAGMPILNMLDSSNNIVHSDLTAIIAGPFTPTPPPNYAEPQRQQPYREFTIHYHEVLDAVQAFPDFYSYTNVPGSGPESNVLNAGEENFAINYGTGGIGAEILANRFGVGPEGACPDCKFEEFFLSAWAVGDPAQVVDKPANGPCTPAQLETAVPVPLGANNLANPPCKVTVGAVNAGGIMVPVRKATQVLYSDDPSNVYHSYINDHVVFRILHGGSNVTHVHHQHAHQWLKSDDNDNSTYLDSQMISPGASYTLDISYNGSGNRNKVVGDSIFHCHFYPHFAAGMWSMWRSHDVFEAGTTVVPPIPEWNRALPDFEINGGSPIPAIVPMPGLAMAPLPARVKVVPVNDQSSGLLIGYTTEVNATDLANGLNPGFPFFIPGIAGVRAPHPPLDFAYDSGKELNGGLPRHLVFTGTIANEAHSPLDFSKDLGKINALQLPESGTTAEQVAMKYHSVCFHASFTSSGAPAQFRTNGLPPVSGAPFADPTLDPAFENANREDNCTNNQAHGLPPSMIRRYKAAALQTDVVINKAGWHYPQSRMLALWSDVLPTMGAANQVARPPQPFFFRANSGEGVEYWHTNLIPDYYLLDDWEVRTPTDIIGQHIHLVKFDVTASDGAANGYNYEDGTFSPGEVQSRIASITACGGLVTAPIDPSNPYQNVPSCGSGTSRVPLKAQPPPAEICTGIPQQGKQSLGCPSDWNGAQTTVQRWFADPLKNTAGKDRTIRTVFTHDHFGPSTHQQTGLYAALLVEPTASKWYDNENGGQLGTGRADGGPTTWQAAIETPNSSADTYREFAFGLQDTQFAYDSSSPSAARTTTYSPKNPTWADPTNVLSNAPGGNTPTGGVPVPGLISSGGNTGTFSVNYRNEPLGLRVDPLPSSPTLPLATQYDSSWAFASLTNRPTSQFNVQPTPGSSIGSSGFVFPPALTQSLSGGDPYTPMMRAYENDNVQVRLIAGAHAVPHTWNIHGVKWLFEPGTPTDGSSVNNSGFRNTQAIGISEHFELLYTVPRAQPQSNGVADYLYMADSNTGQPGIGDGPWGLMRAYQKPQGNLRLLSNNSTIAPLPAKSGIGYNCPTGQAVNKTFNITAIPAIQALNGPIVLNSRTAGGSSGGGGPITSYANGVNSGLLYVMSSDLSGGVLKSGVPIEPLILRVNAGDCVQINLTNAINTSNSSVSPIFTTAQNVPPFSTASGSTQNMLTSALTSMHVQELAYDITQSNGATIGLNSATQTAAANNGTATYYWYAGNLSFNSTGQSTAQAAELGAVNIVPADPIFQNTQGLVATMVVEPANTTACPDKPSSRASAYVYPGSACYGTPLFHEFVVVSQDDFNNSYGNSDAVNYGAEPILFRYNQNSGNNSYLFGNDISCALSNALVGGDPKTPVFQAKAGEPIRLRMVHPGGNGNEQVMTLHGHVWQEEPYLQNSTAITTLSTPNSQSNWQGSRDEHGTNDHFEIVTTAGGPNKVSGDYLFRTFMSADFQGGMWGIVRVCGTLPCPAPQTVSCPPGAATPGVAAAAVKPAALAKPAERGEEFRRRKLNDPNPPQKPQQKTPSSNP
jgi:hypothetical protein